MTCQNTDNFQNDFEIMIQSAFANEQIKSRQFNFHENNDKNIDIPNQISLISKNS